MNSQSIINIKTFYCPISEHRTQIKSGIVIYPLPEIDCVLRDRIYSALKNIGVEIRDFIITDPTNVLPWCQAVGIQPIDTDSLLVIWTLNTDPETCVQIVREVVDRCNWI